VALAAWATQRSDPGFTGSIFSCLPLENGNVAIVKKKEEIKQRKKRKIRD
jgi:hypothetical protein